MLHNKELRYFLLLLFIVTSVCSGYAFLWQIRAGIMVLIACLLLCCCFIVFTCWRYYQLRKLSQKLVQIRKGDYSMDIRDNKEGELSILKNDIYKVTTMLSEHNKQMQNDKIALSNSLSDISHQLKTPLTSMTVMTDLLSSQELPTEKRIQFTNELKNQLQRMEWLLSSLLKLSKIDAGTIQFKQETVNCQQLLQQVSAPFLIPMELKEQTFKIKGADFSFVCDQNWTAEALINILKNCIEHTPTGGSIQIICSDNPLFTQIEISDTGCGIDKSDLPYIFNRFYKGKNASSDSVGIGLAMAHSIIEAQNGTIHVKSALNKGSQFTIQFFKQII